MNTKARSGTESNARCCKKAQGDSFPCWEAQEGDWPLHTVAAPLVQAKEQKLMDGSLSSR